MGLLDRIRRERGEHKAGRPVRNPFSDPAVEADLYRRAQLVVDQCYLPSDQNQKKEYCLAPRQLPPSLTSLCTRQWLARESRTPGHIDITPMRMGKTSLWALVYIYYNSVHGVDNLDYFVDHLKAHLSLPAQPIVDLTASQQTASGQGSSALPASQQTGSGQGSSALPASQQTGSGQGSSALPASQQTASEQGSSSLSASQQTASGQALFQPHADLVGSRTTLVKCVAKFMAYNVLETHDLDELTYRNESYLRYRKQYDYVLSVMFPDLETNS